LRTFTAERRHHQWVAAVLAILMPVAIIILFVVDGRTNIMPGPQLIYVESWPANRSDEEIKAQQKIDQAWREKALKERQEMFRKHHEQLERLGL
jgi:hypothetical protein